jgi:hypothetical protein
MDWAAKEKQAEAQLEQARRHVQKAEWRLEYVRELRREEESERGRGSKALNGATEHGARKTLARSIVEASDREIADLLLEAVRSQPGRFTRNDVVQTAESNHPERDFKPRSVERPFQKLEQRGLIRVVEPRNGPAPAVYEACEK